MRARYAPPPSPGPECDTPESVRDFYADVDEAQYREDLRRPTAAELAGEDR